MRKNLSDLELDLLKYLEVSGPKSSREAADEFGESRGFARTTVATLMDRLREKGYLQREKVDGIYRYASVVTQGELMQGVVGRFVDRALGGSVMPLVAYLAEAPSLTDAEIAELRRLVDELGGQK
jgi:predicted transcriptional regulator